MKNILIAAGVSVLVLIAVVVGFYCSSSFPLMLPELSKVAVLVLLPGFLAWANMNLTGNARKSTYQIATIAKDTQASINFIKTDISGLNGSMTEIKGEVRKIRDVKNIKAQYRRDMLNTQDMCLEFMRHSDDLFRFAALKADSFRSFVMDIHDMDITSECVESSIRLGTSVSEEIRIKGYSILGAPFMDHFYKSHAELVDHFLNEVCRVFTDPDNSKHERFQEHCMRFMKSFLSELNRQYIAFNLTDTEKTPKDTSK